MTRSGSVQGREGPEGPTVQEVREVRRAGSPFVLYVLESWEARFPRLAAGITAAGPEADFGVGTVSPAGRFFRRHAALAEQLGFPMSVMARQVHGSRVVRVGDALAAADGGRGTGRRGAEGPGGIPAPETRGGGPHFYLAGAADGLLTDRAAVLLAVTAADCIPVYLVEPTSGVVGLLHAGWRGVAAGVLEAALGRIAAEWPGALRELVLHLGPGICGSCYEVGPEVREALGLAPAERGPVDLRAALARRAVEAGVSPERVSISGWCPRCEGDRFHSHRGSRGSAGRMAAYIGWRDGTRSS